MQKPRNVNLRYSLFIMTILVFVSIGFKNGSSQVAQVTKIIGDVDRKIQNADWQKANKADPLYSGDQIRTGKKSLAILKFLDASMLRVREQSNVTIKSEMNSGGGSSRTVTLDGGTLGFEIQKIKTQNDQFKFTSPTSVASIRGTKGKMSSRGNSDTVIVIIGTVNLKNLISVKDTNINEGFIGFSNTDGSISSRKATENELSEAENTATGRSEIGIEFKDPKGKKKVLKIRYKQ